MNTPNPASADKLLRKREVAERFSVPQRFAMSLMRHSDIKLTSKIYTDETQLPIYDFIKDLPRLAGCTQIRAQILGAMGHNVSQAVAMNGENAELQITDIEAASRGLSLPVAKIQLAVRGGFEQAPRKSLIYRASRAADFDECIMPVYQFAMKLMVHSGIRSHAFQAPVNGHECQTP